MYLIGIVNVFIQLRFKYATRPHILVVWVSDGEVAMVKHLTTDP